MTWKRGRQLTTLQTAENSIQYKYDSDSIRTSKIVNGVVHTYEYLNGLLMHETRGTQAYDYYYDANGQLYAVSYKLSDTDTKKVYYFTHNWRGDIVGIYNGNGDLKATYSYDAWGNVTAIEDASGNAITSATHIANLNPFRYRGYYMDTETGLYYVLNRYYDSVTHRFVNADAIDVLKATPEKFTNKNLFAYCDNNPNVRIDTGGQFWESVFDVISLGASIVEVGVNPTDIWAWAALVGDTVDLVPFVTGAGELTRAVKTTVKVVDNTTEVVPVAKKIYDATSDIKKSTGSYEILYKSGYSYIGKGGFDRAINSATRNAVKYRDEVIAIRWKSAPNHIQAFIDEYHMQKRLGGVTGRMVHPLDSPLSTYNKIWSPGRRYHLHGIK